MKHRVSRRRGIGIVCIASALLALNGCGAPAVVRYAGPEAPTRGRTGVVLMGDPQRTSFAEFWREQNDPERRKMFASVAQEEPAALILLGDLVFQADSRRQWSDFNEFAEPVRLKGIPVFPLLGNHEHFGNTNVGRELFYAQFPHLEKRQWYAVTVDGVACILLNSLFEHLDDVQIRAQEDWYQKTLNDFERDSSVAAIVVCCHHPPYTHSTVVESDTAVRNRFALPFLKTKKGTFFFTGHCHAFEHFLIEGKHFVVSGGGGGPRQRIDPEKKSDGVPADEFPGSGVRFFHYCRLTRTEDSLLVEVKGLYSAAEPLRLMSRIAAPLPARAR